MKSFEGSGAYFRKILLSYQWEKGKDKLFRSLKQSRWKFLVLSSNAFFIISTWKIRLPWLDSQSSYKRIHEYVMSFIQFKRFFHAFVEFIINFCLWLLIFRFKKIKLMISNFGLILNWVRGNLDVLNGFLVSLLSNFSLFLRQIKLMYLFLFDFSKKFYFDDGHNKIRILKVIFYLRSQEREVNKSFQSLF